MAEASEESSARAPKPPGRRHGRKRQIIEWVVVIVAAAVTAVTLRAQVVQAFEIPSLSMAPTLRVGDRVLVNKLGARFGEIDRGDIVVFKRPPGAEKEAIKDLIKRVIGLPGDTVSSRDGKILINGKVLDEPYLPVGTNSVLAEEASVAPGRYWVMGDNRTQSRDSRFFGTIPRSAIIGKAFVRIWPTSHWGGL